MPEVINHPRPFSQLRPVRILHNPPQLCRSGVEPPTGKLHPRESRGTANRKQEPMKRFISEDAFPDLELRGKIWRGWIVPVGGSTPDRLKDFFVMPEVINHPARFSNSAPSGF